MVQILRDDGVPLAVATEAPGESTETMTLARVVTGKGRLFGYYFAQGRRAVYVRRGMVSLPGSLRTTWLGGERLWQVRFLHPEQASAAEKAPALASPAPD
jgi:hypothetical protein